MRSRGQLAVRPGLKPRGIPQCLVNLPLMNGYLGIEASSWLSSRVGLVTKARCTSLLACAWGAGLKSLDSLSTSSQGTVPRLPSAGRPQHCCVRKTWLMMSNEFLGLETSSAKHSESDGGGGREGLCSPSQLNLWFCD